jgi:putative transposase
VQRSCCDRPARAVVAHGAHPLCEVLHVQQGQGFEGSVIIHSDQGSQFGSDEFSRWCKENRLSPSMSRRGNCWDNAVAESFFSSLKKERIRKRIYKTRDLARADVFDYIEVFYNRTRRHSHLGGVSPEAFERASN